MKQRDRNNKFLPFVGLAAFFLFFVQPYLLRQFWFDEALTLMNFAWMPNPVRIYQGFFIPNNQIFYTVALHYWIQLPVNIFRADFFYRLLSLLFALGTLSILYIRFRRSCGSFPLLLALGALAFSPPFLIYATALRGYMASAFFVALAVGFAVDFQRKATVSSFVKYTCACLLAVGTIPSNLLALGGCVLYALPLAGKNFWRMKRSAVLCLVPFLALALVYLPIYRSFLSVCRLGEGWQDGAGVLRAWFLTAGCVFGPLWLLWLAAFVCRFRWQEPVRAGILLLPVAAVVLLPVSPFPRVFFPLFPLLALVIAGGIRRSTVRLFRARNRQRGMYAFIAVLVLFSGVILKQETVQGGLSERCGGASGDDFFLGYYMRRDHVPQQTALNIEKIYGRNSSLPPVYLSFQADPWPTMYYFLANGLRTEFLFDGPRGRIAALTSGGLVVINRKENPETVTARFGVTLIPLFQTPMHSVFKVR